MSHFNESTLEKLVSGSASPSDVQRIRRHVEDCRACARRLEEWRDNFTEVDEWFPELAMDEGPATTLTPGGLVVMPTGAPRQRFEFDLANMLWVVALLMALLVGYGASRLRSSGDGLSALGPPPEGTLINPAAPRPVLDATRPPTATPVDSAPAATESTQPPAPATAPAVTPPAESRAEPRPATSRAAADPPPRTSAPAQSPASPPERARGEIAVSPRFTAVPVSEAARRLGGRVRLIDGLDLDHLEVGPAVAVPGAQEGLDVVRVVYKTPEGGRILLDQQLIPVGPSGFRPIDDPTLETGETAFGTASNGVSVATWLDEEGYRISLVVQAPVDSLRKLVQRVH